MIDIAKDLYLEFFNSFQTYVARNIVSAPKDKAILFLFHQHPMLHILGELK